MNRALWIAAFWLALVACTYLALTPSPPDAVSHFSDVVLHAFAFTVLTFLCAVAHFQRGYLYPALWMLAYGIAIEVVQGQIEARTAEFADLMVDAIGIAMGLALVRMFAASAFSLSARALRLVGLEGDER